MINMDLEEEKKKILKYYKNVINDKNSRYSKVRNLLPELKSSDIILDYGCGNGFMSHWFYEQCSCYVDAVDIDKNEIIKAKYVFENKGGEDHIHQY